MSVLRILLLVLLCLGGLIQCGGDGDNGKVEFAITPKSPVVINADLTLNPGTDNELVIKAPWFRFGFKIHNKSPHAVTVQSLVFTVVAITTSGITTTEYKLDPGDVNATILAEIPPNQANPTAVAANFYAHGLAKNATSFNFSVTVDVQGWFGEEDAPEKRLTKSYSFVTR